LYLSFKKCTKKKVGMMTEPDYKIIEVNNTNVGDYDLFCQKTKKNMEGYQNKLKWIKERYKEGLKLKLLLINEGGKKGYTSRGFIEYIPGEYAWRGICADGYMVIHCLWVIGKHKKKGYCSKLLEHCINDAKNMNGVAVVTTERTHLVGSRLFQKKGFEKCDTFSHDFDLYVKRFSETAPPPKFTQSLQE